MLFNKGSIKIENETIATNEGLTVIGKKFPSKDVK